MMAYEGGYTSAVDSASHRGSQDAYVQQAMRLLAQQEYEHQQAVIGAQQQARARAAAGSAMMSMMQPPPAVAGPQAPMPGAASVPMMQPGEQQAPGPMPMPQSPGGMAPGSPDQIPGGPPPGWQTSPSAPVELGGLPPAPSSPTGAPSIAPPPKAPELPPEMLSVPNLLAEFKKANVPPEVAVDALKVLEPIINAQNKQAIQQFQAETSAQKAAIAAYKATIDDFNARTRRTDVESKVTKREDTTDIANRGLDIKSTAAAAKAAKGTGGGATSGLTPAGLDIAAAEFLKTGKMPPLGTRNAGDRQAIINRAGEMSTEQGTAPGDVPAARGAFKSDAASLGFQQKQIDSIERSSVKIEKDIKTLEKYIDSGSAGSVKLINKPINYLREQFSDPALSEFAVALKLVGVEYERMINGGLMSVAQLHEGAREDAAKLINEDMTPTQIRRILPVMRQEIANAKAASKEQIGEIKARMKQPKGGAGEAPGAPAVGTVKQGYRFKGGDPAKQGNWERVR